MKINLMGDRVRLILKDNVIAILAEDEMTTVSGAIYNGGLRKTKAILNMEVPEEYGDRRLHDDPIAFVKISAEKLELKHDFISLITAAKVKNFSLVREEKNGITVSVIATAGCSHAESAGEEIDAQQVQGTINVIVVTDSSPSESCLVAALATAVEAKASAMRDLDIRSRYTGQSATGTITDSVVVAATNAGISVNLAGPASHLGQLVAHCTRKAVKEAINRQGEALPTRSVADRLRERHLSVEALASELSKVKPLGDGEKDLSSQLSKMLCDDPLFAASLLSAAKIDEDTEKGLFPQEFKKNNVFGAALSSMLFSKISEQPLVRLKPAELDLIELPPNIKLVLMAKLGIECSASD